MRAAACIDGFSLYYGLRAMRARSPQFFENRWLDLRRLAQELAPGAELGAWALRAGHTCSPFPAPCSLLPAPFYLPRPRATLHLGAA